MKFSGDSNILEMAGHLANLMRIYPPNCYVKNRPDPNKPFIKSDGFNGIKSIAIESHIDIFNRQKNGLQKTLIHR